VNLAKPGTADYGALANTDWSGNFSVGGHSKITGESGGDVLGPDGRPMSISDLVDIIVNAPGYKPGMPVDLLICNAGFGSNPIAQQLANALGAPVWATDTFVWPGYDPPIAAPMGPASLCHKPQCPDTENPGSFQGFYPYNGEGN
jgi:hypothetical protein